MHRQYVSTAVAAYYSVSDDAVAAIDAAADADQDGALAVDRDGGIDAIVATDHGAVQIAERCRPLQRFRGQMQTPDFSLREQTATGDDSEFRRLLAAHLSGRDIPSTYVFAIGAARSKDDCLDAGLQAVIWIDTADLLELIDADDIPFEQHRSSTGELTRYYDVADLRPKGCIIDEAWNSTLTSAFDDSRRLDPDFPRSNPGCNGDHCRLQDFA